MGWVVFTMCWKGVVVRSKACARGRRRSTTNFEERYHTWRYRLYKVQVLQKLMVFDKQRWLKFMKKFTEVLIEKLKILYYIRFLDECHFWINEYMNEQKMCLWCDENLCEIDKAQLHSKKLILFAIFSSHGIIGSDFFFSQNVYFGILPLIVIWRCYS